MDAVLRRGAIGGGRTARSAQGALLRVGAVLRRTDQVLDSPAADRIAVRRAVTEVVPVVFLRGTLAHRMHPLCHRLAHLPRVEAGDDLVALLARLGDLVELSVAGKSGDHRQSVGALRVDRLPEVQDGRAVLRDSFGDVVGYWEVLFEVDIKHTSADLAEGKERCPGDHLAMSGWAASWHGDVGTSIVSKR